MELKLNQKNFNILVENFNHKMTDIQDKTVKLEVNVGWLKRFAATQTGLLVAIFLTILGIIITQ